MNKIALSLLVVLPMYGCDAGSETAQPQAQKAQANSMVTPRPTVPLKPQEIAGCLSILSRDTTLTRSSRFQLSGDLRPFWRVSGRVQNTCPYNISNATLFVVVFKKGGSYEELDSSELILTGTVAANSTRGIEEDVQLRIATRDGGWEWNIYPISGQLGPLQP
jgi:hypothetical protein